MRGFSTCGPSSRRKANGFGYGIFEFSDSYQGIAQGSWWRRHSAWLGMQSRDEYVHPGRSAQAGSPNGLEQATRRAHPKLALTRLDCRVRLLPGSHPWE